MEPYRSHLSLLGRYGVTRLLFLGRLTGVGLALLILIAPQPLAQAAEYTPWADAEVPDPPRECRATWIATVYNLDWPSKPGLPVATQQAELRTMLDGVARLNLNTVVLQVRTMCDAFYDSPLEPWSYYLTGKVGRAPEPYYDPLAFAVEECHARGLELHAWINPFRATTTSYGGELPDTHIVKQFPWLTRKAGPHLWLDPSTEFVRNRAISVTFDIVNRYDLDGIQIDDYFYPYPGSGGGPDFNDDDSWMRYFNEDGTLSRDDWRRQNVDDLVKYLYDGVKRAKPWVKFGVSPFGIWSKRHPPEVPTGLDARAELYADSRRWLREGWLDYLAPQLYWKIEGGQSFPALARWWHSQNSKGRHIWPGIATSRVGSGGEGDRRPPSEMTRQIEILRKLAAQPPAVVHPIADNIIPNQLITNYAMQSDIPSEDAAADVGRPLPDIEANPFDVPPPPTPAVGDRYPGHIHWHWEVFAKNRGSIVEAMAENAYPTKAAPPPSPWLVKRAGDRAAAGPPLPARDLKSRLEKKAKTGSGAASGPQERLLTWEREAAGDDPRWWVVQIRRDGAWRVEKVLPGTAKEFRWTEAATIQAVAIQPIDLYGRQGEARAVRRR